MSSLFLSLQDFNQDIKGGKSKPLQDSMKRYDYMRAKLQNDFHKTPIGADEISASIQTLLENLNLNEAEKKKLFHPDLTVYDFLLQLSQAGHPQIDYIIELIDEKTKSGKFEIFLTSSLILTGTTSLLTTPAFYPVFLAIQSLFSSIVCLPVLGLIYTGSSNLYNFYQTQFDKRKTLFDRTRDSIFLLATTSINIVAYCLLIAASAKMNLLVASLFVTASILDVVKEIVVLIQVNKQYKQSPPINENNYLNVQQSARRDFGYEMRRNAMLINLASALLLTAIMTFWCFVPGGIFVTAYAITAITVVNLAKKSSLKVNEVILREQLQNILSTETIPYTKSLDSPAYNPMATLQTTPNWSKTADLVVAPIACDNTLPTNTTHTPSERKVEQKFPAGLRPFFAGETSLGKNLTDEYYGMVP